MTDQVSGSPEDQQAREATLRTGCYLKLPTTSGRTAAHSIARSVLQSVFAAAAVRGEIETAPVVVVCDEFQELVAPSSAPAAFQEAYEAPGLTGARRCETSPGLGRDECYGACFFQSKSLLVLTNYLTRHEIPGDDTTNAVGSRRPAERRRRKGSSAPRQNVQ